MRNQLNFLICLLATNKLVHIFSQFLKFFAFARSQHSPNIVAVPRTWSGPLFRCHNNGEATKSRHYACDKACLVCVVCFIHVARVCFLGILLDSQDNVCRSSFLAPPRIAHYVNAMAPTRNSLELTPLVARCAESIIIWSRHITLFLLLLAVVVAASSVVSCEVLLLSLVCLHDLMLHLPARRAAKWVEGGEARSEKQQQRQSCSAAAP